MKLPYERYSSSPRGVDKGKQKGGQETEDTEATSAQ